MSDSSFNHLPLAEGASQAPVRVPYVCQPYTGTHFFKHPQSRGINSILLLEGLDHPNLSSADAEAFVQEWLFFGTLVEVFRVVQIEIPQAEFIAEDGSQGSLVIMAALTGYIRKLQRLSKLSFTPDQRQDMAARIRNILRLVSLFAKRHVASTGRYTSRRLVRPEIGLSLVILAVTLENASFHTLVEPYPTGSGYEKLPWFPNDLLKERLLSSGLCPATVNELQLTSSPDTQYYIGSLLQPPNTSAHSKCSISGCVVGNISESAYKGHHVRSGCVKTPCRSRMVNQERLSSVLSSENGIPIILVTCRNAETSPEIEVVNAHADIDFVAISHVWAHGMGNPNSNSLPHCIFQYLTSLVRRVSVQERLDTEKLGFWIDTLCVPVGAENQTRRQLAITRMAQTYKSASRVLLIDSSLQKLDAPKSALELRFRILLSDWYHRLWTLQEGVLAKKLCVAFRDRIVNMDNLYDFEAQEAVRMQLPGGDFVLSNLMFNGSSRVAFRTLRFFEGGMLSNRGVNIPLFALLPGLLSGRRTSKAEDEAICLAVLLGHPVGDLLGIKDRDQRMCVFYSKLDSIPPDLLFYSGPKLAIHGYHWAPRTFLGSLDQTRLNTTIHGMRSVKRHDELGLESPYPALYLTIDGVTISDIPQTTRIFTYDEGSERWLMITTHTSFNDQDRFNNSAPLPPLTMPALVIKNHAMPNDGTGSLQPGAIVLVESDQSLQTTTRFECLVDVRDLTGQHNQNWAHDKWPFLDAVNGQAPRVTSERVVCVGRRRNPEKPFWIA